MMASVDAIRSVIREEAARPSWATDGRDWRQHWRGAWWIATVEWLRLRVRLERWTGSCDYNEPDGNVLYVSLLQFAIMRYWVKRYRRERLTLPKATVRRG